MQRYHAGSCTSAVNNNAIGGPSARDAGRSESSLPANYLINSRRQPQLTPYKLRCDKEPLNSRLGPPDFFPQAPNCPEETLTREYVQSGYRETVEGLEEAREISLTQVTNFNKTVVLNCKEAIRKRLRAINESRVQKRKAGQVYGTPLSGSQLTKPGVFPELRPCGEDLRKKWIEGLSQQHKRLRSLADHVPHGYKKKQLLEVLIKNNVPLLKATWFIKVTYLNQVRPGSASASSGTADKTQLTRSEHWTKDVVDYLQSLLDEFFSKNASHFAPNSRDRSPQMPYAGSLQHRMDSVSSFSDSDEPFLHFKWWYVVRLLQWHHTEGLILPSLVIDWVLTQFKEKQMLEILQLLLPIIYGFLETIVLSQAYVRSLAGIALRIIRDPAPGGSDLVDNSRRAYTTSALIEMLRYLILAAPDTFVALDCFPLPSCVLSHTVNDGNFVLKTSEVAGKIKNGSEDVAFMFRSKGLDAQYQSLAFSHVISSIQKHAEDLVKAANPGYPGYCLAKAAQVLDRSLVLGDIQGAYKLLFDDLCDGVVSEGWISKVSPCLRLSLKWIGTVNTSLIHSVFFLCEWATCDFRDFRSAPLCDIKFTGRKDISQVHIAVRILKMKMRDMRNPARRKNESIHGHVVHKGEGLKRLHLFIVELIRAGIFYPLAYVRQLIVSGIMDFNVNVVDLERQKRHFRILKQLPGQFLRDALEESGLVEGLQLEEALQIYSNERRLMLHSPLNDHFNDNNGAGLSGLKKKFPDFTKDGTSMGPIDQWKNVPSKLSSKNVKNDVDIEELKEAISMLLQLPDSFSNLSSAGSDESQGSVKRPMGSPQSKTDLGEGTPGCEECRKAKRLKLSEERNSLGHGHSPVLSDDEDTWWVKKGLKSLEPLKVDQPLKPIKQVTKSRQKSVRKTQSLAQLAAARIEGSQGASTSHVCDNRVNCPHHRSANDGNILKSVDGNRTSRSGDIVSIGKMLKRLRFVEKRSVTVWLMTVVRRLVEDTEKNVGKVGQFGRSFTVVDGRSSIRWKLGEDELSAILYLMDISDDLVSAVKFLLWLLPKVVSSPNSTVHSGRNVLMLPRNVESQVCDVGEAFLLSSLRRYENILAAADLIPEALSTAMHRTAAIVASNGRISGSGALPFTRYLLKKYGNVTSVIEWEKNFKATCDKRLSSELESGRLMDGELGIPLGAPTGVEDLDDFFRQKISGGRLSRVGLGMRDIVQRNVEEAIHYLFGKERKVFTSSTIKGPAVEKWDNGYQTAQQIVVGLVECIRQTGGAAQEGDPSLVSSAVSAIVGSVGPTLAKMPDFSGGNSHSSSASATTSLNYARCILRMHITCLCLLKEALGERQSRVFEIALATEAFTALAGVFAPGKASRVGAFKVDGSIELYVHWFRLLVGNCRTICEGLVVELLGEPSIIALLRMQRMLPLSLVFPPAYSIFAFVMWRPFILNANIAVREDMNQLYQSLTMAMNDAVKHLPFRDICLRDSQGLYNLMTADASDAEFANLLELNGSDMHLKSKAFVPLRARLFLNAIIDCKMLQYMFTQEDGSRISGHGESKIRFTDSESKLQDKLVNVLDSLQPAKFHWQWVELRLLLNEQALIEKLEAHDMSLADAIQLSSPSSEKAASASENENNFIEFILTSPGSDPLTNKGDKKKIDAACLEEGEVVEEGMDLKRTLKGFSHGSDSENLSLIQQHVTERALIGLILPCIDKISEESRNSFANDLIKQLYNIEQQITAVTRGPSKSAGGTPPGIEGQTNKVNSRKNIRGGSPGLGRRPAAAAVSATDSAPPSAAALRASMSLRLQLLMRFLPILCTDREPSVRNMRNSLASVIFRLLCNRVVHEDADVSVNAIHSSLLRREVESPSEAALVDFSVDGLFDRCLLVLHALLCDCLPSWLKSKPSSKTTNEPGRDFSGSDRELLETLQNELDRVQLPDTIRWRIQAAMPVHHPSLRCLLSCQPPSVPLCAIVSLQPGVANSGFSSSSSNVPQKNLIPSSRSAANASGKLKQQDNDFEVDPWILLEDGAGLSPAASNTAIIGSGDHVNLRAASWLKGAIRMRRTDLTYIGAVDDES
ncbi:hypothetical protein K1719_019089 [Acacia pycnantha]|nr:hypothetical protein K1719_019089 [Acacia pycnantha]